MHYCTRAAPTNSTQIFIFRMEKYPEFKNIMNYGISIFDKHLVLIISGIILVDIENKKEKNRKERMQ